MKIRTKLINEEKKSYAGTDLAVTEDMMDCSLGCNPYGFPESVAAAIDNFDKIKLTSYPHSHAATDGILKYWSELTNIEPHNVMLTDGSIAGIYLVINILAKSNAKVLGFAPQFSEFVSNAKVMGMRYTGVPMYEEENYKISVNRMLEAMTEDVSLIYIDNPNNPTGQLLSLEQLEEILEKADKKDIYVLIDEAYGDFVSKKQSAINIGAKYKNIIVLRTFSKGFGMAGVRAGYIITSKELNGYMNKVSNPYMMGEMSREIAAAALNEDNFLREHIGDFIRSKEMISANTGMNLFMADTNNMVPICLLYHKCKNVNLAEEFMKRGIVTVPGTEFENLGISAVRVRVPRLEDMTKLTKAVKEINETEVLS